MNLIFTCGGLMTGLVPEIQKIGAYAKGKAIKKKEFGCAGCPGCGKASCSGKEAATK